MKGVETLSGAMQTTAVLSPSGIRMPEVIGCKELATSVFINCD